MTPEAIHDLMCEALVNAGAESCDNLLPYEAVRADAYFRDDNVIVEVKTLTSDRNKTDSVRKRSGSIMQESMDKGGPIIFGDVTIPVSALPKSIAEKLVMNLGDNVRKDLRKASSQFKETANALGVEPHGLVLLGVPAHFDTHPGVIATVSARVLHNTKHLSIEGLLIVQVPVDGASLTRPPTISYHSRSHSRIPHKLIHCIVLAWLKVFEERSGASINLEINTPADFESIYLVDDEDWPGEGEDRPD